MKKNIFLCALLVVNFFLAISFEYQQNVLVEKWKQIFRYAHLTKDLHTCVYNIGQDKDNFLR